VSLKVCLLGNILSTILNIMKENCRLSSQTIAENIWVGVEIAHIAFVFGFINSSPMHKISKFNGISHQLFCVELIYQTRYYVVRRGGDTRTTISPRTKSIPTVRVAFLTISSSVSSSTS